MKLNLEVTIDEVVEQTTCGRFTYDEVVLSCYCGTGHTAIIQGEDEVLLSLEQGKMLYKHLQSVFGG